MVFISAILLLLSSCAFKSPPPDPPLPQPYLVVSWSEGFTLTRTLLPQPLGLLAASPITLPFPFPGRLKIESQAFEGKVIDEVEAFVGENSYILASSQAGNQIDVLGLPVLLDQYKKSVVKLALKSKSPAPWVLEIAILANPEIPALEHLSLASFDSVRRFIAPGIRLDLLKAVKVTNTNHFPIELQLGGWAKARLRRNFTTYTVYKENCSHTVSTGRYHEDYYGRFTFLPMEEDLSRRWATFPFTSSSFTILPGESLILGLYGDGPELAAFIDRGVPAVSPAQVKVAVRCYVDRSCAEPEHKFCKELVPEEGYAPSGTAAGPVNIFFEENSNEISIRYAINPIDADPVSTRFEILPNFIHLF